MENHVLYHNQDLLYQQHFGENFGENLGENLGEDFDQLQNRWFS